MRIRCEKPEEFSQIYELVKVAFQTANVSNGKEQDFVDQLRASGNYIPELALVAEEDGLLIGHIMLTKTFFAGNEGRQYETLLLAPVSVALPYRKQGVGTKLIHEAMRLAIKMGHASVFLVGDPGYYHRFGFKSATDFGITNKNGIPDHYVMARELVSGSLTGQVGTIEFFTGE